MSREENTTRRIFSEEDGLVLSQYLFKYLLLLQMHSEPQPA